MTKEITKAIILQEIQDKLKLRELVPARFTFLEDVRPVYNIERHLEELTRYSGTYSVTGIGAVAGPVVPSDEEWFLHRYNVIFVTGTYTVAGVYIGRPTSTFYTYLDLTAAQSASYINDLPKDVKMRSGDRIYMNIDGYTTTGDITLIFEITKEKIR